MYTKNPKIQIINKYMEWEEKEKLPKEKNKKSLFF